MKNKKWETHEYKFYTTHDLFINGEIIESFIYHNGKVNILGNFFNWLWSFWKYRKLRIR